MHNAPLIMAALLLPASVLPAAAAENAAQQLSDQTAKNLAVISASLSQNQKAVNAMVAARADAIVAISRAAALGRVEADRELAILANTAGGPLVKAIDDLRKQADAGALVPKQLNAADAVLRADVIAAAAPGTYSVEKLDAAAKKLAELAKPRSNKEQLEEYARFVKDTKAAADKLQADAATKSDAASKKTDAAVVTAKTATARDSQ